MKPHRAPGVAARRSDDRRIKRDHIVLEVTGAPFTIALRMITWYLTSRKRIVRHSRILRRKIIRNEYNRIISIANGIGRVYANRQYRAIFRP